MVEIFLSLALQLLLAAQRPNVPIELKIEAVRVATLAINMAENSTNVLDTTAIVPSTVNPSFGSVDTTPVKQDTPSVDLKVNDLDSVDIKPSGCITNFVATCAPVRVSWNSSNVFTNSCSITANNPFPWSGNFGSSGEKTGNVSATSTTLTFTCNSDSGYIFDSVVINLID